MVKVVWNLRYRRNWTQDLFVLGTLWLSLTVLPLFTLAKRIRFQAIIWDMVRKLTFLDFLSKIVPSSFSFLMLAPLTVHLKYINSFAYTFSLVNLYTYRHFKGWKGTATILIFRLSSSLFSAWPKTKLRQNPNTSQFEFQLLSTKLDHFQFF